MPPLLIIIYSLLGKYTLAKGIHVSFKNIERGINSRKQSLVGVEYLKTLIKSAGSLLPPANQCTSFFQQRIPPSSS